MIELLFIVGVVAALAVISLWADRRFRSLERLPMQWSVTGTVNWTAPRRLALAFTPAFAALVLGAVAVPILLGVKPRPGDEHLVLPILLASGFGFLLFHGLHLWLISRTLR